MDELGYTLLEKAIFHIPASISLVGIPELSTNHFRPTRILGFLEFINSASETSAGRSASVVSTHTRPRKSAAKSPSDSINHPRAVVWKPRRLPAEGSPVLFGYNRYVYNPNSRTFMLPFETWRLEGHNVISLSAPGKSHPTNALRTPLFFNV